MRAMAATGSPMACLTRFAVSRCSRTVVSVLWSVASLSAHCACSQAYLSASKMFL